MVALNEQRLLFNGNKLRSMAFRSGHDPQLSMMRTQYECAFFTAVKMTAGLAADGKAGA